MPLVHGKSRAAVSMNIRELMKPSTNAPSGRPQKQAVAIALKTANVKKIAKRPPLLVKNHTVSLSDVGGY